jgi:hypothetical protein
VRLASICGRWPSISSRAPHRLHPGADFGSTGEGYIRLLCARPARAGRREIDATGAAESSQIQESEFQNIEF